jgi:hypothetical protein
MDAEEKKERLYYHFLLFWPFLFEIFNLYDVHERDLLQSLAQNEVDVGNVYCLAVNFPSCQRIYYFTGYFPQFR